MEAKKGGAEGWLHHVLSSGSRFGRTCSGQEHGLTFPSGSCDQTVGYLASPDMVSFYTINFGA